MLHSLQILGLTSSTYNVDDTQNTAAFAGLFIVYAIAAVFGIIQIVGMWKTFTKAGRPGWAAIVPFYNYWVLAEIAGRPGSFGLIAALVAAIPFVGWIASVVMTIMISLDVAAKFGKTPVFGVVGLWLFGFVGYNILGFGSAVYDASGVSGSSNGPTVTPVAPTV